MAAKEISVKKYVVRLSGEERERLEMLIRKGKSPARRVLKARILLKADVSEAGKGWSDNRIIEALETSPSVEARRLVERFEWHYTPKHGSWLDLAESELGANLFMMFAPLEGAMKQNGATTVIVQPSPFSYRERDHIISSANGLATLFGFPIAARDGALIAYGPDYIHMNRSAPLYVDRILKGTKPANLPVEQPTKIELRVN